MNDQRVSRQLHGVLGSRTLTLRAATSRERQDQETRELVRYKLEEVARKEMKETEKQKRAQADKELLFLTVPIDDAFQEEDEDSQEQEDSMQEKGDSDSDWEDLDQVEEVTKSYNTMPLKHFARECERYDVSDRTGAKLGNGLLRDLGIVKKGNTSKLICPTRLRRQRQKWGAIIDKEHSAKVFSQGIYTDGKRIPTLVRDTKVTRVKLPGARRGRAAYKTVQTTGNKLVVEDHYPVVSQPGGEYVTHVTPPEGTGLSLANELVSVIQESSTKIR